MKKIAKIAQYALEIALASAAFAIIVISMLFQPWEIGLLN